jgi:hypothetical protein
MDAFSKNTPDAIMEEDNVEHVEIDSIMSSPFSM